MLTQLEDLAMILAAFLFVTLTMAMASNQEGASPSPKGGQLLGRSEETDLRWVEMSVKHYASVVQFDDEYPLKAHVRKEERAKGKEKDALAYEGLALLVEIYQAQNLDKEIHLLDGLIESCKELIELARSAGNAKNTEHREGLLKQLQEIRSKMITQRANSFVYRVLKTLPSLASHVSKSFSALLVRNR